MNKLFSLIFLSFHCAAAIAQSKTTWYSITAFLPNWNGATVSVVVDDKKIHTGTVQKDIFSCTGKFIGIRHGFVEVRSTKAIAFLPVFIEPGAVRIRDGGNKNLVAFGTTFNDTYLQLNRQFDSVALLESNHQFSVAMKVKRDLATSFIRHHPSSIVSLQLMKDYFYLQNDGNDTLYYSLHQSLDEYLKNTFYGRRMALESRTRSTTAVGRKVPIFSLCDTANNSVPLYLDSSYTLIDFWASWCAPCRKENPALWAIYTKYKNFNFRIVGVSLDTNKDAWLKAIRKDHLTWNHASDLRGWSSIAVTLFGIKSIPTNYLLDEYGVIVAKNLHAEQLDEILGKLLQGSKIDISPASRAN
jgi:thiol-disulfide isomerase/thioredoxin